MRPQPISHASDLVPKDDTSAYFKIGEEPLHIYKSTAESHYIGL